MGLFEKFLVWLLVVVFNKLKKNYPNSLITQYAIIDVDQLDQTIKEKIGSLTPEDIKSELIQDTENKAKELVEKIKEKLEQTKK